MKRVVKKDLRVAVNRLNKVSRKDFITIRRNKDRKQQVAVVFYQRVPFLCFTSKEVTRFLSNRELLVEIEKLIALYSGIKEFHGYHDMHVHTWLDHEMDSLLTDLQALETPVQQSAHVEDWYTHQVI